MFKKTLLFIFILSCGYFLVSNLKADIIINDNIFNTEVVFFEWDKNKGLGDREELKENKGMLFFYFNKDIKYFWMKDMQFPIDILWINGNRIVNISENVSEYTNKEITKMNSVYPVDKVVELKAGVVSKYEIKINDKVLIEYKY